MAIARLHPLRSVSNQTGQVYALFNLLRMSISAKALMTTVTFPILRTPQAFTIDRKIYNLQARWDGQRRWYDLPFHPPREYGHVRITAQLISECLTVKAPIIVQEYNLCLIVTCTTINNDPYSCICSYQVYHKATAIPASFNAIILSSYLVLSVVLITTSVRTVISSLQLQPLFINSSTVILLLPC